MKKLLAIILTITTMITVTTVAVKFRKDPIPEPQPIVVPDGGISVLPPEKKQVEASYAEMLASINETDLKKDLYYLASNELEGRMSGKNGNRIAAEFIKKQFESFGLQTTYHKFQMGRYNPGPKNETGDDFSQNIYGWIDGSDPVLKNEIVVVGAHMDHIGYGPRASQAPNRREIHPGADDNASGTVGVLAIARAMSMQKIKCKRTVVFMAFSGEEMGLIGSQFYCNNPLFPKGAPSINKHVAMINMDMIGYLKRGQFKTSFFNESSSVDLDKAIKELNTKYAFARSISGRGGGGSDHAPFYNKKVPVVCLHTGMHAQYHTPDDTANRINYQGLEQVVRYAFELSYRVTTGESRPQFNHATFREMNYNHDHDFDSLPFPVIEDKRK